MRHKNLWHLIVSPPALAAIATFLATVALCTLLFYFTPLRFWNPVDPPIRDIEPQVLYEEMHAKPGEYLFVDVRTAAKYTEGHAEGSINIPIHDLYDDRFALPRSGKTIVLICGDAKLAGVAYGYLEHHGFLNLARIEGGLAAWKTAGLPIHP